MSHVVCAEHGTDKVHSKDKCRCPLAVHEEFMFLLRDVLFLYLQPASSNKTAILNASSNFVTQLFKITTQIRSR